MIIYASPFPVPSSLSSFIKPNPLFKTRMSTQRIAQLIDEDCLFLFIHIHCVLKQISLTSFQQNASTLRQMALARMLVIVSTIFILTSSPIVALSITTSIVYDFFINRRYTNIFLACHLVYMELGMINSSGINFFVYVLRSSRFRHELGRFGCFRFLNHGKEGVNKKHVTAKTTTTGASSVSS